MNKYLLLFLTGLLTYTAFAQETKYEVVTSAVPFLNINPESRGGGMGDAGVATTPDVNSMHWNPAKFAFVESKSGVSTSFTPWLKGLGVNDINLAYLTGYHKIDDIQGFAASLRVFSIGSITFYDPNGVYNGTSNPFEMAIDVAYARQLSKVFSGSVAMRYILSDPYGGSLEGMYKAHAFASDVAFLYTKDYRKGRQTNNFAAGINLSNIGSKISYDEGYNEDFLPANLRLGVAYTAELDKYNTMLFTIDANKLLVPLESDSLAADMGTFESIFRSFSDAPGGFKEEMKEITYSLGVEYLYNKQFAVRGGYFYEDKNKGGRQYITMGGGLKMNVFALDFSYIFATGKNSPLASTLRFSLGFDLDSFQNQKRRGRRR